MLEREVRKFEVEAVVLGVVVRVPLVENGHVLHYGFGNSFSQLPHSQRR